MLRLAQVGVETVETVEAGGDTLMGNEQTATPATPRRQEQQRLIIIIIIIATTAYSDGDGNGY